MLARDLYTSGTQYSTLEKLSQAIIVAWEKILQFALYKLAKMVAVPAIQVLKKKVAAIKY